MIHTGLIGVTGYAAFYLDKLLEYQHMGRLQLIAAVVRNPDETGKTLQQIELLHSKGVKVFPDSGSMYDSFGSVLDFVGIPTGISSHRYYVEEALRHDCDVLVEKPAAARVSDVESMIAARDAAGRNVMVGFQHIYAPEVIQIKSELQKNAIGQLRKITVKGLWPRNIQYYSRNEWAGKLMYNGQWVLDSPVNNAFSHHINLALFFAGGQPDQVSASLFRAMPIETFDTAAVKIIMDNGVEVNVVVSHACEFPEEPQISIEGEEGTGFWCDALYNLKNKAGVVIAGSGGNVEKSRSAMFEAVVSRLEGKNVAVCELEQAINLTRLVNKLHDNFKIEDVHKSRILKKENDRGYQYIIRDMEKIFNQNSPDFDLSLPYPG